MFKFLLYIVISSFLLSNDNSIYSLMSSPRNASLGGMHMSTNNISSIFDAPSFLEGSKQNIFLSIHNYSELYNVFHLSFCIYANSSSNLSIGLVRRDIGDNFNTTLAFHNDGYPDLEDINYENIYKFSDQETGLFFSFNKIIERDFIMGINFKPVFHRIDNIYGLGSSFDIRYLLKMSHGSVSFGVENIFAFKKWDTNYIEKFDLNGYLAFSYNFNQSIIFYEYNMINKSKIGFEIKLIENLFFRSGINKYSTSFGFGLSLKNIILDYTYINNKSDIFGSNHSVGFNINLNH